MTLRPGMSQRELVALSLLKIGEGSPKRGSSAADHADMRTGQRN